MVGPPDGTGAARTKVRCMIEAGLNIVVAAGLAIIVYHHLVYPLLLSYLAADAGVRSPTTAVGAGSTRASQADVPPVEPMVTIIVPAYNEEAFIAAKIRNLAALDYPRWRAVVALDGCRDRTAEIALTEASRLASQVDLEIVEYPSNVGKIAVLNEQIARVDGELVALSDTSAMLPEDALRRAVVNFRDAELGFLAAAYRLQNPGSEGERAYMAQLRKVRRAEAALHSPLGAHGALYFFRRSLFRPIPADTINDDFVLPMQIVEQGYRGGYDDAIEAVELETSQSGQEFKRRVRIGAGNLQQAIRHLRLGSISRPRLAFMFLSGKGLRPLIPLIAILAAGASAVLAVLGWPLHAALLVIEAALVAIGVVAIRLRGRRLPRLMSWLGYLVEGHWASFLGLLNYARGGRIGYWQKAVAVPGTGPRFRIIWPRPQTHENPQQLLQGETAAR